MDASQAESKSKKKRKNKKKSAGTNSVAATNGSLVQQDSEGPAAGKDADDDSNVSEAEHEESDVKPTDISTATSVDDEAAIETINGAATATSISTDMADATARFDVLVKDRDALREEVTKLRQSLEELQSKHEQEMQHVHTQLEETQIEKETADENYQNLLGKVNTIRSQLGDRLKADAVGRHRCATTIHFHADCST